MCTCCHPPFSWYSHDEQNSRADTSHCELPLQLPLLVIFLRAKQHSRAPVRSRYDGDWPQLPPPKRSPSPDGASAPTGGETHAARELHRSRVREGCGQRGAPPARRRPGVLPPLGLEPRGMFANVSDQPRARRQRSSLLAEVCMPQAALIEYKASVISLLRSRQNMLNVVVSAVGVLDVGPSTFYPLLTFRVQSCCRFCDDIARKSSPRLAILGGATFRIRVEALIAVRLFKPWRGTIHPCIRTTTLTTPNQTCIFRRQTTNTYVQEYCSTGDPTLRPLQARGIPYSPLS